MQILLCAATTFEIEPTIVFIRQQGLAERINVQITGIGLTAATYSITKNVLRLSPQLIIQAGIAGSLDPSLALTEAVVVGSEAIGDLGVIEGEEFQSIFDLGLVDKNTTPWKEGKLINPHTKILESTNLPIVRAVSIQEITTIANRIGLYRHAIGAQIETMEGAALHYVGLMESIPFLQLRTISNYIGERNKTKWKMQESIAELNIQLQRLLINFLNA